MEHLPLAVQAQNPPAGSYHPFMAIVTDERKCLWQFMAIHGNLLASIIHFMAFMAFDASKIEENAEMGVKTSQKFQYFKRFPSIFSGLWHKMGRGASPYIIIRHVIILLNIRFQNDSG